VSSQRAEVIRALVKRSEHHPTAEDVFQEVRRGGGRIGLATVYNTLELLRRVGAVSELGFSSGPAHFDLNLTPHANLVCTECGRISDLPVAQLVGMARELGMRSRFEVHRQRLDLYGVCAACRGS
jgi:Fur family peroxide stress response transcriptional regulator